jgi:hypothetical protein
LRQISFHKALFIGNSNDNSQSDVTMLNRTCESNVHPKNVGARVLAHADAVVMPHERGRLHLNFTISGFARNYANVWEITILLRVV